MVCGVVARPTADSELIRLAYREIELADAEGELARRFKLD